ncbi:MAG TPA: oligosaccharide flippase family protein, partial [Steroidobacteraceae bacterium]|nr:oligosaccharide flippase family protein [Steroidobacteraceae bacterium]
MSDPATHSSERSGIDHLLMRGIAWTAVLRFAAQIISWTGTFIAARILTPADYGLFAMAMLAVGLVRMVEDFGLDSVLVQDHSIDSSQQARLAGFAILLSIAFALSFLVLAQPIAEFFKEPQVAMLIAVLGAACIADAFQVIPRAALLKEMEFRKLAIAQFIQTVTMQSILVTGAWLGWGVWSLVANLLGGVIVVTVLLAYWRPYAIRWPRQLRQLIKPLTQGWRILVSRFAWYAYTSADQTIIGRLLGKDSLGAYQQAQALSTAISTEISSVVSKVVPGVFSTVQKNQAELNRYFALLTELLCYLTFPVLFGTAVLADLA